MSLTKYSRYFSWGVIRSIRNSRIKHDKQSPCSGQLHWLMLPRKHNCVGSWQSCIDAKFPGMSLHRLKPCLHRCNLPRKALHWFKHSMHRFKHVFLHFQTRKLTHVFLIDQLLGRSTLRSADVLVYG
jgi:hypothetical protein